MSIPIPSPFGTWKLCEGIELILNSGLQPEVNQQALENDEFCSLLKVTFHFEITVDSHATVRNSTERPHIPSTQGLVL